MSKHLGLENKGAATAASLLLSYHVAPQPVGPAGHYLPVGTAQCDIEYRHWHLRSGLSAERHYRSRAAWQTGVLLK